jgi:hypothetical protein
LGPFFVSDTKIAMTQDENPYASPLYTNDQETPEIYPVEEVGEASNRRIDVFREGKLLVMRKNAILPDRCVKSNEPAAGKIRRNLSWHPSYVYFIIILNIIIYAIVASLVSKKATVYIGLSETWIRKRRNAILIGWMLPLLGVVLFVISLIILTEPHGNTDPVFGFGILGSIVLILGGAIYGIIASQLVSPTRITDRFVWLRGVHPEYIESLPEFPYLD